MLEKLTKKQRPLKQEELQENIVSGSQVKEVFKKKGRID